MLPEIAGCKSVHMRNFHQVKSLTRPLKSTHEQKITEECKLDDSALDGSIEYHSWIEGTHNTLENEDILRRGRGFDTNKLSIVKCASKAEMRNQTSNCDMDESLLMDQSQRGVNKNAESSATLDLKDKFFKVD
jgi:hypothetical protein